MNIESASVERQGAIAASGIGDSQEDVTLKSCISGYGFQLIKWFFCLSPLRIITRNHHGELLPDQILSQDNPASNEEGDSMRQNSDIVGAVIDDVLYVASELGIMR